VDWYKEIVEEHNRAVCGGSEAASRLQLGTEEEPQEAPYRPSGSARHGKENRKDVHGHEVHRTYKKVALEEEERAILFEEVLAKQDAIEVAKKQANDEAEEKRNL
jgi:hypothetical protein